MSGPASIVDNPAWARARPTLSVLTPFLRDDPGELLALLDAEAASLKDRVEIVVLDDGTADAALTARLTAQVSAMTLPARLITLPVNEGRSIGRNRLAAAARGGSLLFLDSDMRPDHSRFLHDWAELVRREDPAVAFGGVSLRQGPTHARFAVHRAMAAKSECVPKGERAKPLKSDHCPGPAASDISPQASSRLPSTRTIPVPRCRIEVTICTCQR